MTHKGLISKIYKQLIQLKDDQEKYFQRGYEDGQ